MKGALHPASARAPVRLLSVLVALSGCAGRLHQVPADEPHALVELRFEHASRDFLYDDSVRIDDGEERAVKSGERVRLRPGTHWLELVSTAHSYGLGTVQVSKPGPCIDPRCTRFVPVTESQAALVETGQTRCGQRLDITVDANDRTVARLHVAPDLTCTVHGGPATRP